MYSYRYEIEGIVQGVGFRPFVHALCRDLGLSGYIYNHAGGVGLHLEGGKERIAAFEKRFYEELPPLARVDSVTRKEAAFEKCEEFTIQSSRGGVKSAFVSPDITLCDNCLREMRDPGNRRYGYFFINCTDCGPRYTIIKNLPYDRKNSSMAHFSMCPACQKEYEDPSNRRYHAQPISCYDCGPTLRFYQENAVFEKEEALRRCARLLQAGEIVAVKGVGGFHLVCDATDDGAVAALRSRKQRPCKPFALLCRDMEQIDTFARPSRAEEEAITSKERPIVIIDKKSEAGISESVAPGLGRVGVFLPYSPLHVRLFDYIDTPLVATSANISKEPILTSKEQIEQKLGGVVGGILDFDREIVNSCDDSVMHFSGEQRLFLRFSRGFAPGSIALKKAVPEPVLALGANQKSAVALAFDKRIVLSPYIADLETVSSIEHFDKVVKLFCQFYDVEPRVVVSDRHPEYESSRYAKNFPSARHIRVQHHYAHQLALFAEFGLTEPITAFSFDGTGYGDDGALWGGEVLRCDLEGYSRLLHFEPLGLLGGEKAITEPKRLALALLLQNMESEKALAHPYATSRFEPVELRRLHMMWERGINTPKSSSVGRLFDAVALLGGFVKESAYEGQTGMMIERYYDPAITESYPFQIRRGEIRIDWSTLFTQREKKLIASSFINTLSKIILCVAKQQGRPVGLSGGVFQNRTLVAQVKKQLDAHEIPCFIPKRYPLNDQAIALGQIWYALHGSG